MQELRGTGGLRIRDVFEYPDGEPSELFINPFACLIDPFMWRELQVQLRCDLWSVSRSWLAVMMLKHFREPP